MTEQQFFQKIQDIIDCETYADAEDWDRAYVCGIENAARKIIDFLKECGLTP